MGVPDFQTLMLPTLRQISAGNATTTGLIGALSDEFLLTEAERSILLPSGRQAVMANRTHWAIAYLNKAGLIARIGRGQYEATPAGRSLLERPPERITLGFLTANYPQIRAFRGDAARESQTSDMAVGDDLPRGLETPRELAERADRELRSALAAELIDRLRKLNPGAFEQLIVDLLVKMGFGGSRKEAGEKLGRSGDGGIDGIIREDALGLDAVYLQAKRYGEDNPVGAPAIQGFAGALLGNGATKGVFVTTSRFTQGARDAAGAYRSHRIVLIDSEELARLMIEHEVGVRTVQTLRIQRLDLEPYEDDDAG